MSHHLYNFEEEYIPEKLNCCLEKPQLKWEAAWQRGNEVKSLTITLLVFKVFLATVLTGLFSSRAAGD